MKDPKRLQQLYQIGSTSWSDYFSTLSFLGTLSVLAVIYCKEQTEPEKILDYKALADRLGISEGAGYMSGVVMATSAMGMFKCRIRLHEGILVIWDYFSQIDIVELMCMRQIHNQIKKDNAGDKSFALKSYNILLDFFHRPEVTLDEFIQSIESLEANCLRRYISMEDSNQTNIPI